MHDVPPPAYVCQIPQKHFSSLLGSFIASIIKFPPSGDQGDKSYADLTCTDKDQLAIQELITNLADFDKLTLFFTKEGTHLKQLGAQINHVHPLKFLATIFKNPSLRIRIPRIAEDYLKWIRFMDGLSSSLTKEADRGKLEPHRIAFCTDIGICPDHTKKFFQNRDWESFVRYLMNFSYEESCD